MICINITTGANFIHGFGTVIAQFQDSSGRAGSQAAFQAKDLSRLPVFGKYELGCATHSFQYDGILPLKDILLFAGQ